MCPCSYLSLECELSCKLHREGLPEGQDMTKGAVLSSLGREKWGGGEHDIVYTYCSILMHKWNSYILCGNHVVFSKLADALPPAPPQVIPT